VEKIYAASETCLLIAEADRVLCCLVMFLPVFLHWIYKMKYSCYQHSLVFLAGLFIGMWLRNAPLDKKKSEITVFKNKLLLVSLLHLAGICGKSELLDGFPSCISTGKLMSNYIAVDVLCFLVSCLCRHFSHICKI